jgi:hypothetical protein
MYSSQQSIGQQRYIECNPMDQIPVYLCAMNWARPIISHATIQANVSIGQMAHYHVFNIQITMAEIFKHYVVDRFHIRSVLRSSEVNKVHRHSFDKYLWSCFHTFPPPSFFSIVLARLYFTDMTLESVFESSKTYR